jgi:exonuclease SbcC
MKILKVDLENIGPHRRKTVEFGDGLIALMGPVGSGKSTLVNAVYALITNDFSRLADGKQDAICQQASTGEPSSITGHLQLADQLATITRKLAPSTSNLLELEDGTKFTKETEIKGALASLLGASRALLDNYVFVGQWTIRDLFKSTSSQRSEALSSLCGTKFIEVSYDLVSKMSREDSELLNVGFEDTDRLRKSLADYEKMLADNSTELRRIKSSMLSVEESERLNGTVKLYGELTELSDGFLRREMIAKNKEADLEKLRADFQMCWAESMKAEREEERLRAIREDLEKQWAVYESHNSRWLTKTQLQERLAKINAKLAIKMRDPLVPEPAEYYEKLMEDLNEQMAPLRSVIDLHTKLPDASDCPTCGQDLDDLPGRAARALVELEPLRKQYEIIKGNRLNAIADAKYQSEYRMTVEMLSLEKTSVESGLSSMVDVEEPEKPALDIGCARTSYAAAKEAADSAKKTAGDKERDFHRLASEVDVMFENIDDDKKTVNDNLTLQFRRYYKYAAEALAANRDKELSAAAAQARIDENRRVIAELSASIKKAEEDRERLEGTRRWLDVLNKVSPVLHRDALPKDIHSDALRQLEGDINSTLLKFECPFQITTGDDLSYLARFHNGTSVPAHRLSGGQQVVLSLAMRWALNSLFASQIGLLVLDEPTAGLDDRHLGLLQSCLARLGAAARNRGCQVIIITHEQRLRGVFDQVIELDRPVV